MSKKVFSFSIFVIRYSRLVTLSALCFIKFLFELEYYHPYVQPITYPRFGYHKVSKQSITQIYVHSQETLILASFVVPDLTEIKCVKPQAKNRKYPSRLNLVYSAGGQFLPLLKLKEIFYRYSSP